MWREIILMKRNGFVYIFRVVQVPDLECVSSLAAHVSHHIRYLFVCLQSACILCQTHAR